MANIQKITITVLQRPTLLSGGDNTLRVNIGSQNITLTAKGTTPLPLGSYIVWPDSTLIDIADALYNALTKAYGSPFSFVRWPNLGGAKVQIVYSGPAAEFSWLIPSHQSSAFSIQEEITPPPPVDFSYSLSYSAALVADACTHAIVAINQANGAYPLVIDYGLGGVPQQKTANSGAEAWVEVLRGEPSQTIFVTENGGQTVARTLVSISLHRTPEASFIQIAGDTTVTVVGKSSHHSVDLIFQYSFDNLIYSYSNIFETVPSGAQTFYVRDQLGCTRSVTIDIPIYQISEVYAVHNPLNFIIEKTTAPENVLCTIEVNGNSIGDFKAIPFDVDNGTNRYILFADEAIRANMPLFDDYPQPQDAMVEVTNMAAEITIKETLTDNEIAFFIAVNAARQIGGTGAKMTDLVNNQEQPFIFVAGQPGYIYFYDNAFFREKILLTSSTDITRIGITKSVEVLQHCTGDVILKYIDRNGMYRFYKFDKGYEVSLSPSQIGKTQSIFESIATAQGITKNIGYKNDKQLSVTALKVPDRHMESLQDIFVSPRVYMHIGDLGLDARENWLLVDVEGEGPVKHPKRKFNDVRLTITLPQQYNVTML